MKKLGVFRDPQEASRTEHRDSLYVSGRGGEKMQPVLQVCATLVRPEATGRNLSLLLEAVQRHEIRSVICKLAGTQSSRQGRALLQQQLLAQGAGRKRWSEEGSLQVLGGSLAGCPLPPVESGSLL